MNGLGKHKVVKSAGFWKTVLSMLIVFVLFYVMTSDLQEYHTFYMNKLVRPSSKHFVCVHLQGKRLEQKLFEFAYGFGIAQSIGSALIMCRNEDIRKVFKMKQVKFLKTTKVCETFSKVEISNCTLYDSSVTRLSSERHYNLQMCDMSDFPSIKYFDVHKQILLQHLQFMPDIDSKADAYFRLMTPKEQVKKLWTNIAVYIANMTNLAEILKEDHLDYMKKYLTVAINYYTTRISNARFLVYAADEDFVKSILSKQNITSVYINDKTIIENQPEILMRVLSLCDHVITSGAADMFGWWIGYFSTGTVVYPRRNTDDLKEREYSNKDLYPHNWIGLVF